MKKRHIGLICIMLFVWISACSEKSNTQANNKQSLPDTLSPYDEKLTDTLVSNQSAFMDEETFWRLIEESKVESNDMYNLQVLIMTEKLRLLPVKEIEKYENRFLTMMNKVYTWEMYAAAKVIDANCTAEEFEYFRGWLISQGRKTFENCLKNPDNIAQLTVDKKYVIKWEGFSGCGKNAFINKTDLDYITVSVALKKDTALIQQANKKNLPSLYPTLWAKFRH